MRVLIRVYLSLLVGIFMVPRTTNEQAKAQNNQDLRKIRTALAVCFCYNGNSLPAK